MKPAPYRLVFFLVALVVLGVFAAAVTIPNVFTAGDAILAEEVNANFATLAAASEALDTKIATVAATVEDLDGFEIDVTDLTDRIEAVESDVDAVATTVTTLPGPVDVVVTAPAPTVEEMNLPTSVVTTVDGRWLVSQGFEGYALCPSASDVRFFLTIDHQPVASTIVYASHNTGIRATLSGPTEGVVPAGEHELRIGAECVGPDTVATAVLTFEDVTSIVVFPE